MNSNLKEKCTKGSNKFRLKLDSKKIKQPKLSKTTLQRIDDNLGERDLTKHNWIQKSK